MVSREFARKTHLLKAFSVSVSGGSGSGSFVLNKPLSHLYVNAPNSFDTYKVRLKDLSGNYMTKLMVCYPDDDGVFSTIFEKDLPTMNEVTVELSSCSSDGDFVVSVMFPNV